MMEITRDIITDLLPLYIAGEVSKDTRQLVEQYLKDNPEMAEIAEESKQDNLKDDIPVPLNQEDKMNALLEAKKYMFKRTLVWAGVIALGFIFCMVLVGMVFVMMR